MKLVLDMEVGLGPGDFVLDGSKRGVGPHLTCLAHSNIAILTQLFTVKQKHVSASVYEQSQPALRQVTVVPGVSR